jgi:quinoprotein glucose dehydrogenase
MTVDHGRGIVYVPTGSATPDFYGGARVGQNLFANTLLALDARTGERIWHYQVIHHDLWDRDLPAPPNLVTVTHNGTPRQAVAQITKSAHVFLFDRDTGEPLFPVEELEVTASDLPGEVAWPTQPVPTLPPPFSRQEFTENDLTDVSPEARASAFARLTRVRSGGQFVPPSREGTIVLPGYDGGGEWGGAAVDPQGILYVNASEMPWILRMVGLRVDGGVSLGATVYANECLYCHGTDLQGDPLGVYPSLVAVSSRMSRQAIEAAVTNGVGSMPAHGYLSSDELEAVVAYISSEQDGTTPSESGVEATAASGIPTSGYTSTGYIRFLDDEGHPAIKPPWGTLTAIDLNDGSLIWQVPLGELDELTERGLPPTGTENYGGPIVSAGGVLFIGATKDQAFRAFNTNTGALLWETELPAGGYATPATYAVNGRQYVVIAAGGGKMGTKSGDSYVAFALPE